MYHGTNIQWARTTMQVQTYLRAVAMSFGVTPQIAIAGNVSTQAVRAFLARRREEERRANLTYCNKVRCRDATLPFPRHSWYNRSRRRWNSRNQGGTKQ